MNCRNFSSLPWLVTALEPIIILLNVLGKDNRSGSSILRSRGTSSPERSASPIFCQYFLKKIFLFEVV